MHISQLVHESEVNVSDANITPVKPAETVLYGLPKVNTTCYTHYIRSWILQAIGILHTQSSTHKSELPGILSQ